MSGTSDWNILVVEDEPDGQAVVSGILRNSNIATDAVGSAEEALSRLANQSYTGVVIDLALPGMDGMDLLTAIRNDPSIADLPCVAITAFHSSKVKKQALDAGFDAYLSKPIDRTMFVEELSRVVRG